MIREPNWVLFKRIGAEFEEEMDINAAPDAPAEMKLRHRPMSYTGQIVEEWRPGPAPAKERA